ncbi:MAG: DNA polymerase III subunit delta [Rhodospirillum sp.]|nr:DNA polymerase III subunit delta [Rhodospirillum sp.]MCF8491626.1 DNA polymerase III subunit delta [Rhodospirillum sp.]MCF8500133.1 DNA polymerase III subunit delta [Rhodospirillum sp.]
MKLSGSAIDGFLKAPKSDIKAVLVYGPDEGLVRERVDRLMRTVLDDLKDPFRVFELTGEDLKADPARLSDEAAALSLSGGRRVGRIRQITDQHANSLKAYIEHPKGDTLVVLQGGDLGPRSSLRKLFEGANEAASLPCYGDEGRGLETVIRDMIAQAGFSANADVIDYLVTHLGGDRGVTRSELGKLITYCGNQGQVTLDDAMACVGDTAQIGMEVLTNAVAEGNTAEALRALDRLTQEGTNAVAILRGLSRHFTRLHLVSGLTAQGRSVDQAVTALKPPILFKMKSRFQDQAQGWALSRLGMALDLLLDAEKDAKSSGLPDAALLERVIIRLAKGAGRRRR